MISPIKPNIGL